jgi:hypothetical protein
LERTNRALTKTGLAEKMRSMFGGFHQFQDFTSVGGRPMSKQPQNRFRRLVLVGPRENQRQPFSAASRFGSAALRNQTTKTTQPTREQLKALRMAVMPTFSRGIWLEAMRAIGRFVRSYFGTDSRQQRGAVVLSFRRHGFRRPWAERGAEKGYVTKKASGSVCWNNDQASQEGGRA